MKGIVEPPDAWRKSYYSESEIETADTVACPFCKAKIGAPCMDYAWHRSGLRVSRPHHQRYDAHRLEKDRLRRLNRARIDAWRASPEYAAMLARRERARANEEARRVQDAQMRAIRLHHPPRSRSEACGFVPPVRVHDDDEPLVIHPQYPIWKHRRRERSMKAARVYVHPEAWIVVREAGMVLALSAGLRRGSGPW